MTDKIEVPDGGEYRPRTLDEDILRLMLDGRETGDPWGRHAPTLIADELDYTNQHVAQRMQLLAASGYLTRMCRGVYEITEQGIRQVEDSDVDAEEG